MGGSELDGTLYNSDCPQCIAASPLISGYIVEEQIGESAATSTTSSGSRNRVSVFSSVDEVKGFYSSWTANDERRRDVRTAIHMHLDKHFADQCKRY